MIEIVVVLAIFAILLGIAAPSFTAWLRNVQIRTASDSLQNGLQLARAEAIRRNRSVMFWLTSTANPLSADWLVACANPPFGTGAVPEAPGDCPGLSTALGVPPNGPPINWIQRQAAADQQTSAPQIVATPNNATVVTFNSLGIVTTNPDGSAPLTAIDVSDPTLAVARPLRVTVGGGQIRLCDPGLDPAVDPRGC
jgi:type IV fimbrial biogenesis protein FimT